MENSGFEQARHVEPVLQNMLELNGVRLTFQTSYHSVYNNCEYCFRFLKSWLRKNSELADHFTEIAICDALSRITPGMSLNFFRHCGYTDDIIDIVYSNLAIIAFLYFFIATGMYYRKFVTCDL